MSNDDNFVSKLNQTLRQRPDMHLDSSQPRVKEITHHRNPVTLPLLRWYLSSIGIVYWRLVSWRIFVCWYARFLSSTALLPRHLCHVDDASWDTSFDFLPLLSTLHYKKSNHQIRETLRRKITKLSSMNSLAIYYEAQQVHIIIWAKCSMTDNQCPVTDDCERKSFSFLVALWTLK